MAGAVGMARPAARLRRCLALARPPEQRRQWDPVLPAMPATARRSGAGLPHGGKVAIRFEAARAAPSTSQRPTRGAGPFAGFAPLPALPRLGMEPAWTEPRKGRSRAHPVDFSAQQLRQAWRRMPGDLKLIALVVPMVLLLALDAAGPRLFSRPLPIKAAAQSNLGRALSRQWREVRGSIARRAGFEYADDFHSGLDAWTVASGRAANWSYDNVGFVKPGNLGLLRSTLELADYDVQFVARIERKGLGFVFRAKDTRNYEAVRLVMTKPGPLPELRAIHYATIEGREGPKSGKPVPAAIPADAFFDVRLVVHGDEFTLMVQDKIADFWTDDRLSSGGIGFFCGKGEMARIGDVEVSHHNDTLGRFCAYIAPQRAGGQ